MTVETERQKKAFEISRDKLIEGWNCGQSVLAALQKILGLENSDVLRATTGFGGGVGNMGYVCGGLAAGVLILGQLYGRDSLEQYEEKENTYQLCAEWMKRFAEHFGSKNCYDILKVDLNDVTIRREYWASNENRGRCANHVVGRSARLLMAFIEDIERNGEGASYGHTD